MTFILPSICDNSSFKPRSTVKTYGHQVKTTRYKLSLNLLKNDHNLTINTAI